MSTATTRPSAATGIVLIVKRELGQYFSTWSGYLICGMLLFLTGLFYNVFAVGNVPKYSADVLSDYFYYQSGTAMVASLFFSMRLIAEERQAGSLPLLSTSSLTDGQVILAKYLSALLFLAFFLVLTFYMPVLILWNGKVSLGHLVAGYLGILLIGSASVAIGVFGSAVAKSQLIALIVSAVILVAMLLLWLSARVVSGPLGEVVAYLSLHDKHFRPFMEGNVSTTHAIFYVSVTAFFLTLARNVLEGRRWRP